MKRYSCPYDGFPYEDDTGDYVEYEDAARIVAQRDRLADCLRELMLLEDWSTIRNQFRFPNEIECALAELDKEKQS